MFYTFLWTVFFSINRQASPIFSCIEHQIRLSNSHVFNRSSQLLPENRQLEKLRVKYS